MFRCVFTGTDQYRICRDGSDSDACFKREVLKNDKGETWFEVTDSKPVGYKFTEKIRMPTMPCERCTLSMRWDGLHESVIFASCADIKIGGGAPHPGRSTGISTAASRP